ncbi:MAG: type III-B CRISPR module-associated protein Cmr5 [candidate division WOR-3 bacterium]|nr:type III-B CRISPR module-associated protein Cmr5 [candidate division WOR-3 bacterium]
MPDALRNLEHKRAEYALECVKRIKGTQHAKRYKTLARSSGSLILKSGLIQALIFYLSKGEVIFVKDILEHCGLSFGRNANAETIAQNLVNLNQDKVMRITQEALQIIKWLKRFAEIMIEDKRETTQEETRTGA